VRGVRGFPGARRAPVQGMSARRALLVVPVVGAVARVRGNAGRRWKGVGGRAGLLCWCGSSWWAARVRPCGFTRAAFGGGSGCG
jgi:hypothetical protein